MDHNYPALVALGLVVGAFGTLVGAGGGFLLAPILLLAYPGDDADTLTSISLCVVMCNALSGTRAYARMGLVDRRSGTFFALAGMPGAILGAVTTHLIPRHTFNIVVGAALFIGAVLLLIFPGNKNGRAIGAALNAQDVPPAPARLSWSRLRLGMILSTVIGYLSSLLGIGGGIIHVPVMVKLLDFPVHMATATSHMVLAVMALTATLTHVATGAFAHGIRRAIALSIGAMIGAPLGAKFSTRVGGDWIMRALAAALGSAAVRILWLTMK